MACLRNDGSDSKENKPRFRFDLIVGSRAIAPEHAIPSRRFQAAQSKRSGVASARCNMMQHVNFAIQRSPEPLRPAALKAICKSGFVLSKKLQKECRVESRALRAARLRAGRPRSTRFCQGDARVPRVFASGTPSRREAAIDTASIGLPLRATSLCVTQRAAPNRQSSPSLFPHR